MMNESAAVRALAEDRASEPDPLAWVRRRSDWVVPALLLGDALALALSAGLGLASRLLFDAWVPVELKFANTAGVFICLAVVPFCLWLSGLYPGTGVPAVERLRRRTLVTLAVFMVIVAFDYVALDKTLSRGFILTTFAIALVVPPLVDAAVRHRLRAFGAYAEPVVVIGLDDATAELVGKLRGDADIGYRPVVILADDPAAHGSTFAGLPVYAPLSRAGELAGRINSALVPLAGRRTSGQDSKPLDLPFLNTILLPQALEHGQIWVNACEIGGATGLRIRNNLLVPLNAKMKRAVDAAMAAALFVLTLPVLAASAAAIWALSPGPVLFRQIREGLDGEPITIYKLRTMCMDAEERLAAHLRADPAAAEEWQQHFKLRDDPRLIPFIGGLLRETSIDELPQLWNVLEGKLSLVGPRPFPYYHLESFSDEFRALRRRVMPGITGLWQVTIRSDGDIAAQERLDSYYIRNWSLWLDIYILALTVRAVLHRTGAR